MSWPAQKYQYIYIYWIYWIYPINPINACKYQQVPMHVSGVALSSCCTLRKLEADGSGWFTHALLQGGLRFLLLSRQIHRDFKIPKRVPGVSMHCIAWGFQLTHGCIAWGWGIRWYQFSLPSRQIEIAQIFSFIGILIHRDF